MKIGMSNNVNRRMNQIGSYCPMELKLLRAYGPLTRTETFDFEKYLHEHFKISLIKYEWFRYWEGEEETADLLFDEFDFSAAKELILEQAKNNFKDQKSIKRIQSITKSRLRLFDDLANNDYIYAELTGESI